MLINGARRGVIGLVDRAAFRHYVVSPFLPTQETEADYWTLFAVWPLASPRQVAPGPSLHPPPNPRPLVLHNELPHRSHGTGKSTHRSQPACKERLLPLPAQRRGSRVRLRSRRPGALGRSKRAHDRGLRHDFHRLNSRNLLPSTQPRCPAETNHRDPFPVLRCQGDRVRTKIKWVELSEMLHRRSDASRARCACALPREVTEGFEIDGVYLPEGTEVGTPCYSIYRHPECYRYPNSYLPERWIEGSVIPPFPSPSETGIKSWQVSKEDVELARKAFCPFSIGPRGCIGKSMALMEMRLTLARLLFLFEFQGVSDGVGVDEGGDLAMVDHFTSQKTGPNVLVRRRVWGKAAGFSRRRKALHDALQPSIGLLY